MGSTRLNNGERRPTAVEKLRNMLNDPAKFIACPGVYDGFTARIALNEGVDCLYMVSIRQHLLRSPFFAVTASTSRSQYHDLST
jgi:hypothetical protein